MKEIVVENCQLEAKLTATELRKRYDPLRAITLIGQCMTKALFAAKADSVLFWACVHSHYREIESEFDADPSVPKPRNAG